MLLFSLIRQSGHTLKLMLATLKQDQLPSFSNCIHTQGNMPKSAYAILHTYIIGHYKPSVRIIDLVSHTTNVVRVNFIHKWRDLRIKVKSDLKIF